MGCFGGKKQPVYQPPPPPKLPTADELYNTGIAKAKEVSPLAYAAREGALIDLSKGQDYYSGFQPTSFEQALGNQYFQNIFPDVQKNIKHNLSIAGTATSPLLAQQIGKAQGDLSVSIGQYLADQANERARYSLNQRLAMNPFNDINPIVGVGQQQSTAQANLDYQFQQALAQAQYQKALQDYENSNANMKGLLSTAGTLAGGGIGFFVGGPAGASLGAGLGGSAASLFGGGRSPINFGDALSIAQLFQGGNVLPGLGGYGRNTPRNVFDMGSYSALPSSTRPVYLPI